MLITGEPDRCPSSSLWRAERSRLRQQCSDPQVGLTLRHDNHINRLILSEGLKLAVEDVDGNSEPGFLIYGAPVGTDAYCTHQLQKIAQGIVSDAQQTVALLTGERQSLWTARRCSITSRFD